MERIKNDRKQIPVQDSYVVQNGQFKIMSNYTCTADIQLLENTISRKYQECGAPYLSVNHVYITFFGNVRYEVLHNVMEERNMPQTIQRRKASWVGHILRRN